MKLTTFTDLESALDPEPLFHVEPPDGVKHQTELMRVVAFRRLMRQFAPKVLLYANANAGKRNPRKAVAEGIIAGVFDFSCWWEPVDPLIDRGCALVEMKGYSAAGRPGKLSTAQIEFGNRLWTAGHRVACFFDPLSALGWLRTCGAPVARIIERARG